MNVAIKMGSVVMPTDPQEWLNWASHQPELLNHQGTVFPLLELGPVPAPPPCRRRPAKYKSRRKDEVAPAAYQHMLDDIIHDLLKVIRTHRVTLTQASKLIEDDDPATLRAASLRKLFLIWASPAEYEAADINRAIWQRRCRKLLQRLPTAKQQGRSLIQLCREIAKTERVTWRCVYRHYTHPDNTVGDLKILDEIRKYYPYA